MSMRVNSAVGSEEERPGSAQHMSRAREQKLIKLASKGDLDAATALIRAYQGGVYHYIKRLCGRDDLAEDVTQEAFSRVLLNLERFDFNYRFSTWLFTIARRVFLNMQEKKCPIPDSDRLGDSLAASAEVGSGMEHDENNDRSKALLQRALLTLPPEQREIVVLFHQHDWPIWMIAAQLGKPEGTVKSHLFRGRLKLRDEYLMLERNIAAAACAQRAAAAAPPRNPSRVKEPKVVLRSVPVNSKSSILQAVDESAIAEVLHRSGIHAAIPLKSDIDGSSSVIQQEVWS